MFGCRTPQSPEGGETACFSLALVGKDRTQLFFFPVLTPQRGPFYHSVLQRDQSLVWPQIHFMFLSQVPPLLQG